MVRRIGEAGFVLASFVNLGIRVVYKVTLCHVRSMSGKRSKKDIEPAAPAARGWRSARLSDTGTGRCWDRGRPGWRGVDATGCYYNVRGGECKRNLVILWIFMVCEYGLV